CSAGVQVGFSEKEPPHVPPRVSETLTKVPIALLTTVMVGDSNRSSRRKKVQEIHREMRNGPVA
ncbi:MAG: hypothetical protein NZ733_05850, partial [Aigarchaeota archaeon]|nr:hypothetical protein [Aigarchaeota archaeon]